ncbi:AAA domain-containing protein [Anaerobiospirillum thomasii]|uniref:Putative DNA helicase n=1 Tax=Anaerobiospirillum thomasii TaxID=179995 RepID=A0A2X0V7S3_9GAMM|nr:AAA domain-containing protein [Anaerobiospirillum thomasii]SPT70419.1 putative DNA helicase [Anaerobiospirillum thomasii]
MTGLNNIKELKEVKEYLNTYTDSFYIDKAMFSLVDKGIIRSDQISDCIVSLLQEGFIVQSPSSGLKYYTTQTYKLRYFNRQEHNRSDSSMLDQCSFGTFLEILADAYERSHANLEFLINGSQHLLLKSAEFSYHDADSFSVKFRSFDNKQILLNSRYIIGFPVIKFVSSGSKDSEDSKSSDITLVPVFYFNIKDIETVRGEVNTYRGQVDDLTTPFINNYFLEKINEIFPPGKKDTYGSAYVVLSNFLAEFKRKISTSSDPVTESLRLFKHYFYNYFAYKNDFDFKKLSQIGHIKHNKGSEIYNSCLVGQIKNTATSQCAREIREIAQLALQQKLPSSCLDVLYESSALIDKAIVKGAHNNTARHQETDSTSGINAFVKEQSSLCYCLNDEFKLDEYQVQAVKSFLNNKITLLQGPPGTGKTYTIATAAMNSMLRGQRCLISSYNHAAISAFNQKAVFDLNGQSVEFNTELKSKEHSVDLSFSSLIKKGFSNTAVSSDKVFNCFDTIREQTDNNQDSSFKALCEYLYIYKEQLPQAIRKANKALRLADIVIKQDTKLKALFEHLSSLMLKTDESSITVVDESRIFDLNKQAISDLLQKCQKRLKDIRILKPNIFRLEMLILDLKKDFLKHDIVAVQKCLDELNHLISVCSKLENTLSILLENRLLNKEDRTDINKIRDRLYSLSFKDKSKLESLDTIAIFFKEKTREYVSTRLAPHLYKIKNGFNPDDLKQEMAEEVFRHFPVVSTSILSVAKSVPLKAEIFDLIIIDESSQFDFISIIPVLFRAKRVAVVGDPKQLEPINGISNKLIALLLNRVNHTGITNYANMFNFSASAYDFIENYVVSPSHIRKLSLLNNRRSEPKITEYISKYFYNSALRSAYINRSCSSDYLLDADKGIHFIDAPLDDEKGSGKNVFKKEAEAIIELLRGFFADNRRYKGTVGVIAPFVSQVEYIKNLILQDQDLRHIEPQYLYTSTVHSFQGQERDTIIFSLCLKGNNKFVADPHLINVAISRARDYVFVVGSKEQAANSYYSYIRALVQASDQIRKNRLKLDEPGIDELIDNRFIDTLEEGLLFRALKTALDTQNLSDRCVLKTQYAVASATKTYRVDIALIDNTLLKEHTGGLAFSGVIGLAIECNGAQHYVNSGSDSIDYDISRKNAIRYSPSSPLEVMEFRNSEINSNVQSCVEQIIDRYKELIEDD